MRRRTTAVLATALAAAGIAAGGSAIAANEPAAPAALPTAPAAAPPAIGAVQPDQAANFRVLRRPRRASDVIPADVVAQVASPGRFGRNPQLARAVETATGKGWVVPGRDTVCLVVPDPVDGYGTSCKSTAEAADEGLGVQLIAPDESTSSTLLPDDGRVVVTQDDATTEVVQPDASGMAASDTTDASQVTVVTNDGRSSEPVPDGDGTVPPVG